MRKINALKSLLYLTLITLIQFSCGNSSSNASLLSNEDFFTVLQKGDSPKDFIANNFNAKIGPNLIVIDVMNNQSGAGYVITMPKDIKPGIYNISSPLVQISCGNYRPSSFTLTIETIDESKAYGHFSGWMVNPNVPADSFEMVNGKFLTHFN